jgi:HEAT repeat protein
MAGDRHAVRAAQAELVGAVADPGADPRVRAAALGALVRGAAVRVARRAWTGAAADPVAGVRRRAAELTPHVATPAVRVVVALVADSDPLVAETACWAAGEMTWTDGARRRVVAAVSAAAGHPDPLVRESAVAALGALGDPAGLPAILAGCADRPAVRRRAVLALAPFEGPEVDAALGAALTDPDWQTRQAAEDLTVRSAD